MEQIKLFFEKVKTDETLQVSLKKLAERKAGVEEVVALAKEKGFGFTKEAFESFVKESLSAEELSEEQLAAVSGGIDPAFIPIFVLFSLTIVMCLGMRSVD